MRNLCAVITQTGSDLDVEEARELNIRLVPDIIRFGNEEFRTRIDITDSAFYERMELESELPTSSHPSVGDFVKFYKDAGEDGAREILCITVTADMSGSYDTAVAAKRILEKRDFGIPVYVYDSRLCSHGMALIVKKAAEFSNEGLGASDIIKTLDSLRPDVAVYFMLDTLENAQKGGRVGNITAKTADFFRFKPILVFKDGICSNDSVARGYESGLKKLKNMALDMADEKYAVTVFHGNSRDSAEKLRDMISGERPELHVDVRFVGSVIGVFSGKGAIGISFVRKADR